LSDIIYDGGAGSTITGVTADSIEFTTAGTYTLVNCTITEVTNSSGGAVTLTLDNTTITTNTGPNITTQLSGSVITITNLTSANVQLLQNDGTTVVNRVVGTSVDYVYALPAGSTGTWSYCINRAGHNPVVGTFNASAQTISVDGTQTQKVLPDGTIAYGGNTSAFLTVNATADGSRMNLRIGDGEAPVRACFDKVEDELDTEDGMTYLMNGGGEVSYLTLPTGSYLFYEAAVRHIRDNAGDNGATIGAFVQSVDGSPLDGSNGDVKYFTVSDASKIAEYQGFIYVDAVSGTDSSAYPFGTPLAPCKTLANAQALASNFGISSVKCLSAITADTGCTGLKFYGDNVYPFDFNSQSFILCGFHYMRIRGVDGDATTDDLFEDCLIDGDITCRAVFRNCMFDGASTVVTLTGGPSDFLDCNSRVEGTDSITVDNDGDFDFNVRGWKGGMTLTNMQDGDLSFGSSEGRLTVDATCGGTATIVVRGATRVVNNSGLAINTDDKGYTESDEVTTDAASRTASQADVSSLATQASVDTVDSNVDAVLVDTNELQTNQGNWLTATGFATPTNVTDAQTAIIAEVDANEAKIDALETKAQADTRQAALVAEHDATQTTLAGLNDFNPALDVVANVTLVDTVTTNTDMRGTDGANTTAPDNASITAILADTNELQTDWANGGRLDNIIDAALTQATTARKHLTNRDKIDTVANTLTRYDDDGTTSLVVFDLKDGDGAASSDQIFEKDPQ
jgi:hypothetical protein